MEVFTLPDIRIRVWIQLPEACDVDVETVVGVNPARVDDVQTDATITLQSPRVDIEKVFPFHCAVERSVINSGLVEVSGHVRQSGDGDLSIDVPVPGENLWRVMSIRIK